MLKPYHDILRTLGIFVAIIFLFATGFLVFLSATEFTPSPKQEPAFGGKGKPMDPAQREFSFLTWNIGYAGLGKEMDFFYDGGKQVGPLKEQCTKYFDGIKNILLHHDTCDFIFLQEVDIHSKRSWYVNEFELLANLLPGFFNVFASNYDCRFVPVPINDPMGRVVSGIAGFMRPEPVGIEIHYFDSKVPWPKRLVFLKRCYLLIRFGLDSGKELVILNLHNSAYDFTGVLRKNEITTLDSVMKAEYRQGNYIIAGGDWNNNPRGFDVSTISSGNAVFPVEPPIDPSIVPGWPFVFDPSAPTNRNVDMPYIKGVTLTTIIDFFVVSPNVEIKRVMTIPTEFAYSDHQPVLVKVRLR